MPEELDEAQWKAALAWAQACPGSNSDYPSPSSICDVPEDNNEATDASSNQIRAGFRKSLQCFYPLFDTLVRFKAMVKDVQSTLADIGPRIIRLGIADMKTAINLV